MTFSKDACTDGINTVIQSLFLFTSTRNPGHRFHQNTTKWRVIGWVLIQWSDDTSVNTPTTGWSSSFVCWMQQGSWRPPKPVPNTRVKQQSGPKCWWAFWKGQKIRAMPAASERRYVANTVDSWWVSWNSYSIWARLDGSSWSQDSKSCCLKLLVSIWVRVRCNNLRMSERE